MTKFIPIIIVWDYAEIFPKNNLLRNWPPAYVTEGVQKTRAQYFVNEAETSICN